MIIRAQFQAIIFILDRLIPSISPYFHYSNDEAISRPAVLYIVHIGEPCNNMHIGTYAAIMSAWEGRGVSCYPLYPLIFIVITTQLLYSATSLSVPGPKLGRVTGAKDPTCI